MNGFSQTFFAVVASLSRLLAHILIFPGDRLTVFADWCERKAAGA